MNETTDKVSAATINVASNEEVTSTETAEEWRPVVGYEGLYEVSSLGRVRRLKTDYIFSVVLDSYGYPIVTLKTPTMTKTCKVHRLVALAFIPNPDNRPQIDHIDGVKTNNKVGNLRWVTSKQNMQNPHTVEACRKLGIELWERPEYRDKVLSAMHSESAVKKRRAVQESAEYRARQSAAKDDIKRKVQCIETGVTYDSITEAAKAFGISSTAVGISCRAALKGTPRKDFHGGKRVFHFHYVE